MSIPIERSSQTSMDHGVLYDESRSVPPRPSIDTFRQDPILKLSNPSLAWRKESHQSRNLRNPPVHLQGRNGAAACGTGIDDSERRRRTIVSAGKALQH